MSTMPSIRQTPNILFGTQNSGSKNAERLQKILSEAETAPAVSIARKRWEDATGEMGRLRRARASLNVRAKEIHSECTRARTALFDGLIERYSSDKTGNASGLLEKLLTVEAEMRAVGGAIERAVEHLIPLADIEIHESNARFMDALANELDVRAQEQFETSSALLSGAIESEGVIKLDARSGLSGLILEQAENYKRQAAAAIEAAGESRNLYEQVARLPSGRTNR